MSHQGTMGQPARKPQLELDRVESQPRAHGDPPATADLRQIPTDFIVEEVLKHPPQGFGEHVYLWVEKTGANTDWVAGQLARALGVRRGDVAYAGMKDRHAVTRQWFCVSGLRSDPDSGVLAGEGWSVLRLTRHGKKLRHGGIKNNRFAITLRNLNSDLQRFEQRLQAIAETGVPNYFGEQRFGYENLARAGAWACGEGSPPDRHTRGIWLSTLRAAIFNRVLAMRVTAGCWNRLLAGDAAVLAGTSSFFAVEEITDELRERCRAGDISPSGPLWGKGESPLRDAAARFEHAVISSIDASWLDRLCEAGLRHERRPLVLRARDLSFEWQESSRSARVEFELPSGTYATALLREICGYQ